MSLPHPTSAPVSGAVLLLDDFRTPDGRSAIGTRWSVFSDQVMGGFSQPRIGLDQVDGRACLRIRGRVTLKNGGGFIQAAMPLAREGVYDASAWTGVRIIARGDGATYRVHLRSAATRLPWQHYAAEFDAAPEWIEHDLPFDAFQPQALDEPLDVRLLTRIGIVASKRAFEPDLAVASLVLYR